MQNYLDTLDYILKSGRSKSDRTGTGTISSVGLQMRFNLNEGFPLVTTKKCHLPAIIHELIWFLKGETNIQYLKDHNVKIWNEWAVPEDVYREVPMENHERVTYALLEKLTPLSRPEFCKELNQMSVEKGHEYLTELGVPTTTQVLVMRAGEVGPMYGSQWVRWVDSYGRAPINQIMNAQNTLLNNPDSRRIVVSAWNPSDLPDESISPVENVVAGNAALASCHAFFQLLPEPLSMVEIMDLASATSEEAWRDLDFVWDSCISENPPKDELDAGLWHRPDPLFGWERKDFEVTFEATAKELGLPLYRLSLQVYIRSNDMFLGAPFNIASYALLCMMYAQTANMLLGELIYTTGDAHIYKNHFEQVDQQLSRTPKALPTMRLNPDVKSVFDFKFEDFTLEGYEPHEAIKAPIAI